MPGLHFGSPPLAFPDIAWLRSALIGHIYGRFIAFCFGGWACPFSRDMTASRDGVAQFLQTSLPLAPYAPAPIYFGYPTCLHSWRHFPLSTTLFLQLGFLQLFPGSSRCLFATPPRSFTVLTRHDALASSRRFPLLHASPPSYHFTHPPRPFTPIHILNRLSFLCNCPFPIVLTCSCLCFCSLSRLLRLISLPPRRPGGRAKHSLLLGAESAPRDRGFFSPVHIPLNLRHTTSRY